MLVKELLDSAAWAKSGLAACRSSRKDGVEEVPRRFFAVAVRHPVFRSAGWALKGSGRRSGGGRPCWFAGAAWGDDGRGFEVWLCVPDDAPPRRGSRGRRRAGGCQGSRLCGGDFRLLGPAEFPRPPMADGRVFPGVGQHLGPVDGYGDGYGDAAHFEHPAARAQFDDPRERDAASVGWRLQRRACARSVR